MTRRQIEYALKLAKEVRRVESAMSVTLPGGMVQVDPEILIMHLSRLIIYRRCLQAVPA